LDNHPTHKSDFAKYVIFTSNLKVFFSTTHGSRTNPIEYFFGYIKNKLKDWDYNNYEELANCIVTIMKKIKPETFKGFYKQCFQQANIILREELDKILDNH